MGAAVQHELHAMIDGEGACRLRQHHEVMAPFVQSRPDLRGDAVEMSVPLGSGRDSGDFDLTGEDFQSGHGRLPVYALDTLLMLLSVILLLMLEYLRRRNERLRGIQA